MDILNLEQAYDKGIGNRKCGPRLSCHLSFVLTVDDEWRAYRD